MAQALQRAGCPAGFKFSNPPGVDVVSGIKQGEPFKQLLSAPLPSRRFQLPPLQQGGAVAGQGTLCAAGAAAHGGSTHVLAEQTNAAPTRRSGFQVPAAKGSGRTDMPPSAPTAMPTAAPTAELHRQQQQHPLQHRPQPHHPQHPAQQLPPPRPPPESRWAAAAKVQRCLVDGHVHEGRQRQSMEGGEDEVMEVIDGEEEEEEAAAAAAATQIPGFQTAKAKLVSDLRKAGQPYTAGAFQHQPQQQQPRQGLQRPAAPRPAGLRRTQAPPAGGVGGVRLWWHNWRGAPVVGPGWHQALAMQTPASHGHNHRANRLPPRDSLPAAPTEPTACLPRCCPAGAPAALLLPLLPADVRLLPLLPAAALPLPLQALPVPPASLCLPLSARRWRRRRGGPGAAARRQSCPSRSGSSASSSWVGGEGWWGGVAVGAVGGGDGMGLPFSERVMTILDLGW